MDTRSTQRDLLHNKSVQQNNMATETTPYLFAPQLPDYDRGKNKMCEYCLIVIPQFRGASG
jgi:hypothetical protein